MIDFILSNYVRFLLVVYGTVKIIPWVTIFLCFALLAFCPGAVVDIIKDLKEASLYEIIKAFHLFSGIIINASLFIAIARASFVKDRKAELFVNPLGRKNCYHKVDWAYLNRHCRDGFKLNCFEVESSRVAQEISKRLGVMNNGQMKIEVK